MKLSQVPPSLYLTHPDQESDQGRNAERRGVVAEPREVKGNLDAKVLGNVS